MTPARTLSAIYPIRLRADLARHEADAYWAGPHAELVCRGGHIQEYNQYHFSSTDHGYWPPTSTVGTYPADLFRWDGVTEVRLRNLWEMTRAAKGMLNTVFHDEQNVFDNVLGHLCGPRGASWWTPGHDPLVGHRTVLLLRRRRGTKLSVFRHYVHEHLAPRLQQAGALDVRAYTFLPISGIAHRTPGVAHAYPPSHRHDGAVVLGLPSRLALEPFLAARPVASIIETQHRALTAIHAYTVDQTVHVIGDHA